jgi:hypothetical protein
MKPTMCITGPKMCNEQNQKKFLGMIIHLFWKDDGLGQGQTRKKKEASVNPEAMGFNFKCECTISKLCPNCY